MRPREAVQDLQTDAARIVFVSNMESDRWGGSEELWSRTAVRLAHKNAAVAASVQYWPDPHKSILDLIDHGVDVEFRHNHRSYRERAWRKLMRRRRSPSLDDLDKFIMSRSPNLVVLSSGAAFPPLEYVELCVERGWRFVTIGHANKIQWWPRDEQAEKYRNSLALAQRCYFVSDANRQLAEMQLGYELRNADIVRNPFNVPYGASPQWPSTQDHEKLRMACVGRLYPPDKGQDILFRALAASTWSKRNWSLTLYGEGHLREGLERLAERLGLAHRIAFAGSVDNIQDIWATNHVLVMPSRFEGLPLTIVEAMLCGRPVIATDVAGNSEVIDDGVTGFLAETPTVESFGRALERAWQKRADLPQMGQRAGRRIRELVPSDPIGVFSEKIMDTALKIMGEGQS